MFFFHYEKKNNNKCRIIRVERESMKHIEKKRIEKS